MNGFLIAAVICGGASMTCLVLGFCFIWNALKAEG